ncbi:conserved protein of unknown function [Pseudodesulfovibrio profundus]|uniref:Uncharacterized protein n=1 Tax=Pseudodesulfovibrio profundus TaxID=57320 RepID=A0A2C8FCY9_9BACT|nr:hypothetical protein [Pseudodesulfovibrio profundus]MBC16906.1 hypothetical protein [Desulfovibrio sp.]SOB60356.1 conserved protein of unknown function [Pseudodesulfovibrio profundus]|tara:strand:- start:5999 stop:6685 length:687 start_codon:yes stop_codon:yes gene_type:complete
MIYNKKEFYGGFGLLVGFFLVLFFMFQPMFNGHNSMEYLDNLYNSISKGSVNYVESIREDTKPFADKDVTMKLTYATEAEAAQSALLFSNAGATASVAGKELEVSGSLGAMLGAALDDSYSMYHNDAAALESKYGIEGRRALFNWWTSLKLMDKSLKNQEAFAAAKVTGTVQGKAVEAAYNYFGVEPTSIMDNVGLVIFSLAFYVFYTLWYGFAILFVFEGWGLRLSH